MIVEYLITKVLDVVGVLFVYLPDIPQLPTELQEPLTHFLSIIKASSGTINYLYGVSFVGYILPIIIVILTFEHIYHFIMFILRKIPAINIS